MRRPGAEARPSAGAPENRPPGPHRLGRADPELIDEDVHGSVGAVLEDVLHERVRRAEAIDATFARDIAARIARFTLHGGKRLRSQFLWWGFRGCGGGAEAGQVESALELAAGLELIQTCALVHDDVMDGSSVRRGGHALHTDLHLQYGAARPTGPDATFGAAAAIVAGDLALAWADDIVAAIRPDPETDRTVRGIWQDLRTEMVAGQYLDLQSQAIGSRSMPQAIRTACLKSALYSVERPLALGAAVAGAGEHTVRALCSAGRCAGLAFQLRDDLQGVFGDPEHTGKPSGDDIRQGKLTYLVACARARARAHGDEASVALLDTALNSTDLSDDALREVRAVLVATGARALVEAKIDRLVSKSTRRLDQAAVEPFAHRRLHRLLCSVGGIAPPVPDERAGGTLLSADAEGSTP